MQIDASYLSPNVNLAARLESGTHQARERERERGREGGREGERERERERERGGGGEVRNPRS